MNGTRDTAYERDFLKEAEHLAGLGDLEWSAQVADRLHRMERSKGQDSYLELSPLKMVSEIEEEGLDLGGWPVLLALLSYRIEDQEKAHELRLLLLEVAAYGVRVHHLCEKARELLSDA